MQLPSIPSELQIISWFGMGNGAEALALISLILSLAAIFAPVVAGLLLYGLEHLEVKLLARFNRQFAYSFVNYITFPGTFLHEISHFLFALFTGAKVSKLVLFETNGDSLGHLEYIPRGPWFLKALQNALASVAPPVVGLVLGYFLLQYIVSGSHTFWGYVGLWYLLVSLVNHSTMSGADLKIYFKNVWILLPPIFVVIFLTLFL